jgi:hypothetical protein
MSGIHEQCVKYGKEGNYVNYVKGANVAGFMKVAKAMLAQGIVSCPPQPLPTEAGAMEKNEE